MELVNNIKNEAVINSVGSVFINKDNGEAYMICDEDNIVQLTGDRAGVLDEISISELNIIAPTKVVITVE